MFIVADGAYGALIIDGPASLDYDIDLGAFTLGDWYHTDAYIGMRSFFAGNIPAVDSIIIKGQGVYIDPQTRNQSGQFQEITSSSQFTPGLKYRIRLINTSVDTKYVFSIDNVSTLTDQYDYD